MAVNPLYRNEYYFFSNMYDDSLITEFYRKISAESYEKSVSYQQNMLGRKRASMTSDIFYKAKLGDFVVNEKYNASVGLPSGSRSIKFTNLILPVFNKRKFLSTYGISFQKVPLVDFFKRNDIFDKTITLQIGKYRFMSAYLIQNSDRSVTIAIANSNTEGVTSSNFDKIISEYGLEETVWIFSDEITQAYYVDTSYASAISESNESDYYDVKIPKTTAVNNIGSTRIHEQINSWDCLISFNSNTYGRKVLVSTTSSLSTSNSSDVIFKVPKNFIDMIKKSSANFNIWFINRPNKKHILLYPYNKDTLPILNLDYSQNPSGNINIEVFEIDSSTMCKGRKLYDPEFTQIYFPNIFDFTLLNVNKSDLLIEVTEYDSSHTNQVMNNSLHPLIESLGSELYTEFVVNNHDKSADGSSMGLKRYRPEYHPISMEDYISSEYNGNFRGYMLSKITSMIESDPYLAASYYNWMINRDPKVTTLSGTPKTFCFGTGKSGEFTGNNRIVMNTSIASITLDDIQYFTEEHSYITYYNSMNRCPSNIYINGKYIRPTCHRYYKGLNYLFIPVKKINDEMSRYATDKELVAASPITIDTYQHGYMSIMNAPKDSVLIESATDTFRIFEDIDSPIFSLDDIVLYDKSTGKYLGSMLDVFNVNLTVSEFVIKNPLNDDTVLLEKSLDSEYLLTLLSEIYNTMDEKPVIVSATEVKLSLNSFIDELINSGVITADQKSVFMHKRINFKDLEFTPKNDSLVGMDIAIYNRAFKQEWIFKSNAGIYDSSTNTTIYRIDSSDLDIDLSRYLVFINGSLRMDAQLSKDTNRFNGALILSIEGNKSTLTEEIIILHMPVGYNINNFIIDNRVLYMKPAVKTEVETNLLWPQEPSDGIIMRSLSDSIFDSYAFENDYNMKFAGGYRLPPKSKETCSIYTQYYDKDRVDARGLNLYDGGYSFTINNDYPITTIAKQNPNTDSYDSSAPANPLDILTLDRHQADPDIVDSNTSILDKGILAKIILNY